MEHLHGKKNLLSKWRQLVKEESTDIFTKATIDCFLGPKAP